MNAGERMIGLRATMLLADHAAVADGKLYISGGGWSQTGPAPVQCGIAIKLDVPWELTGRPVPFRIGLVSDDGQPVVQDGPDGPREVVVTGEFHAGRPVGLRPGTPADIPLAVNVPPLSLPAGRRYSWVLTVDEMGDADWHVDFEVRADPCPAS